MKEIKWLIHHLKEGGGLGRMPNSSIDIIIEALEKKVPKEPESISEFGAYITCPVCGRIVITSLYCRFCGQALKWGDK